MSAENNNWRGHVAYVDLIAALEGEWVEVARAQVARLLGFVEDRREARRQADESVLRPRRTSELSDAPPPVDRASRLCFWRARAVTYDYELGELPAPAPAPSRQLALSIEDIGRDEDLMARACLPPPSPLAPWSRLLRAVEGVYERQLPIGELDVDAVLRDFGRGRPATRLPRRERAVRRERLVLILDLGWHLRPFWDDILDVAERVRRDFGSRDIEVLCWEDGPPPVSEVMSELQGNLRPGDAVLALSDLGYLRARDGELSRDGRRWAQLGRALGAAGFDCAALVLFPRLRWDRALAQRWRCLDWERPGPSYHARGLGQTGTELETLLSLISWLMFVELPLLRELRRLLGAKLDAEGEVWNHVDVARQDWELALVEREASEARLRGLAATPAGRELVTQAVELVRRRHSWRREVWCEEIARLEILVPGLARPDERARAAVFFQKVHVAVQKGTGLSSAAGVDFDGWIERAFGGPQARLLTPSLSSGELGREFRGIAESVWEQRRESDPSARPPAGLGPGDLRPKLDERWAGQLMLRGDELVIGQLGEGPGVPLAEIEGASRMVSVGDAWAQVGDERLPSLPDLADEILIETTGQQLWLERVERPAWASAMGCDEHGLWASFEVEGAEQVMRWIPPGREIQGDEHGVGFPPAPITTSVGYWVAATPCTQALWEAVMGRNPSHFPGARRPVESVDPTQIRDFLAELNARLPRAEFELPTEERWLHACQGHFEPDSEGKGPYNETSSETREVGQGKGGPHGLYDVLGNVYECCTPSCGDPWRAGTLVLKGVSWNEPSEGSVASWREPILREESGSHVGFRLSAQRAWTKPDWAQRTGRDRHGFWASTVVEGVELRMRWISPGRFFMGSPEQEEGRWDSEGPQHMVTLTRGFWMAETPCTQELWQAVMADNPSRCRGPARPVEQVSWEDVQRFIAKLDEQTTPGFGLPTEAQWEYACRAGEASARYGRLDEVAWYSVNSDGQTHEVGEKLPNAWGLYDMLGNVDEWCSDRWAGSYGVEPAVDPGGPSSGQNRVIRGGGWYTQARRVRAAYRRYCPPGRRYDNLGFRLVRGQGLRQPDERSEHNTSKGEQG